MSSSFLATWCGLWGAAGIVQALAESVGWWGDPTEQHIGHLGIGAIFIFIAVLFLRLHRLETSLKGDSEHG